MTSQRPRPDRPWPALTLTAYPPDWRARYGDELELLIADLHSGGRAPIPMAFNLLCGAVAAWLTIERRTVMSERSRNALIRVLWNWVAFAAVAAWFGHDLAIYPSASAAHQIGLTHPAVPDAYHVLYAAGVVGVAATALAAVAFAIDAIAYARRCGRRSTFVLMAVPVVIAGAWIGGLRLLPADSFTVGNMTLTLGWLLLGVAGIAGSTQAVVTVVRSTEFTERTWRIGGAAAAAVAAAMVVATAAAITWGVVERADQAHRADTSSWLIVTAIMVVTAARAVIALIGARKTPVEKPAVA
jgi:MFS family permease